MNWTTEDTMNLSQFDDTFIKAESERQDTFEDIPDGKYQVTVDRVEMKKSQNGNSMLAWGFKIFAPKHIGCFLWKNNILVTKENIQWLKQDLYTCGLHLEKVSELPSRLEDLLDIKLEITKKTKGEFSNIYLNRRMYTEEELENSIQDSGADIDGWKNNEEAPIPDDDIPF